MKISKRKPDSKGRPQLHPYEKWAAAVLKAKNRESIELVLSRKQDFDCQPVSLCNQVYAWAKKHNVPLTVRADKNDVFISLRKT